jgi:hypothetical protein
VRVVIPEFMDEPAVAALADGFDVLYDQALVDRRDELLAQLATAHALIVRNRTAVDAALVAARRTCTSWGGSVSASTTSISPPAPHAASA